MGLKSKLESDLLTAMKNGDNTTKTTIRMILTNMKLTEVQKGSALDDNEILSILQKEIKSRNETISDAEKINRTDIIDSTKAEIKVIESYLPQQMSQEELVALVKQAITDSDAKSMSDMGKVMKIALPKIQGRAANDMVSKAVRDLLSNNQ